jgi:nucleoside-diphosphate-sugar epimerase
VSDNQRVVVTGGAGYVGSVVTSHLLMAGFQVVVVDRMAAGGESLLGFVHRPDFELLVGDIRDSDVLDRALAGSAAVVHLAAIVGERACEVDQDEARSINLDGARSVLRAAARQHVARTVLVNTCSNYGVSSPDVLADEDAPLNPLGIYASSKVDAEHVGLSDDSETSVCVLRLATICGLSPRMRFDLLVNDIARAAALGDPIELYAPDAWRPFLHICDAARALEWALRAPADIPRRRVFNVVGENYRKRDLVDLVRRHFPYTSFELTEAVVDPRDYRVSGERIRREGGFQPLYTVEDALVTIASAVRVGAFRNPRWNGHAAAPIVTPPGGNLLRPKGAR